MSLTHDDHIHYLQLALSEARKSPPKPTNFCVGAVVISPSKAHANFQGTCSTCDPKILTTGYTLECPGNTHAEQSCFIKLAKEYGCEESSLGERLPEDAVLYTTMEPCNKRSVGNTPCTERILNLKRQDGSQAVKTVVVGVTEPETFVGVNEGKKKLGDAGIQVLHIPGLEKDILEVATAGHEKQQDG
ncbi:hypothetical protein M409DRAFT_30131 [Zasmidium cellare ATCC 36951]|uniref:CMP/dCMP-type deaminase domain-containing protein n=1 Tax=Zasmidium cellare ATCC 36951 TaxID=1080233 RepID=A0A6A6BZQ9_ZASCE|nr:uncharacterized protein M409DRAFT_30131 [Zasmidium cellare ATCC 36951]KAF2159380.1 hypothetical protein M409DRAFT_30131 [Zasmidium cellare ATCC 36951]